MARDPQSWRAEQLALAEPIDGPEPERQALARTLEGAKRGELVHVDEAGDVRGPGRDRVLGGVNLAWAVAAGTSAAVLCSAAIGAVWGGVALVGFGVALGVEERRRRRLSRVAALIAEERLVEAEGLCRELIGARGGSRALRAAAYHDLGVVAARRGDHEEALAHVRSAIRMAHSPWRRGVQVEVLAYQEIRLLATLGRGGEARARMQARVREPAGDYLRLLHATTDLAVRFVADDPPEPDGDDERLWDRARLALRVEAGTTELLALCGWAFDRAGDEDMAGHLLGEAQERVTPADRATFPSLWAWVDGRTAGEAGAAR